MFASPFPPPVGQTGFSLVEVLVATTVFSLGLAGFSALLLLSSSGASDAGWESNAAIAAASLAAQLRLNPTAQTRDLNPPDRFSRICDGSDPCTPAQQADYDFRLWQLQLASSIPNARGLVCHDATPEDGVEGNVRCDGAGSLVIKIFWRGSSRSADGSNGVKRQRFTLAVN